MADDGEICGTWKIVECVSLTGNVEPTGIEGTTFNLDESCDVTWTVPPDAEAMPFFSSETYEVIRTRPLKISFIGPLGHLIEFKLDISDDLMLWTYEGCCIIQCQKVATSNCHVEVPFSFLPALEEGYFSDCVIKAANGKEFKVHQTILRLANPEINWSKCPTPLCGLPEDVLECILYYVYSECLPSGLSEDTGRQCLQVVKKLPGFDVFVKLCETFLKNTALKQQITNLVGDVHACVDRVIDMINDKGGTGDGTPPDALVNNPARLCYILKQAFREAAIAGSKLLILCDLFARRKGELSREERHEIIKYTKSRLPVFMNQFHHFFEVCHAQTQSMTVSQRQEIAAYLVPEIESALDIISTHVVEMKTALEHVINQSSSDRSSTERTEKSKKGAVSDMLAKTLRNALHLRELKKLKTFHEQTTQNFQNLMQQKQNFCLMSQEEKERFVVVSILEYHLDEVPLCITRIEELIAALDDKVTWRDWKYLFKLTTSKVGWVLNKVQCHLSTLQPLIRQACDIVHREQFTESLATLGVLDNQGTESSGGTTGTTKTPAATKYAQLSSVESLCVPPYPADSTLAARARDLLASELKADLQIEVISVQESGDVVIDHLHGEPVSRTDHQKEVDIHRLHAHCVVMAARSDWFRRALLSGMRESIDRRMTVHDTSPQLFRLLLEFIYCGAAHIEGLSTENLAELMALADRYEVDGFKAQCERELVDHIDEDSVLFLLSFADQYNARTLWKRILAYIREHGHVADGDIFRELPDHLQSVVAQELSSRELSSLGAAPTDTTSSMSSASELDDFIHHLDLGNAQALYQAGSTDTSSSDDLHYVEDSGRLESCIAELRVIIGQEVTREELVRISLAADYDANRAVNFYFS